MSGTFLIIVFITSALAVGFVARPFFRTRNVKTIIALAIGVPAFCIGIYLFLGSPGLHDSAPSQHQPAAQMQSATPDKIGSVASMLEGLESRLAENPSDAKGWLLLARSYEHLSQTEEAIAAYAKAVDLGEFDANLATLTSTGVRSDSAPSALITGSLDVSDRAARLIDPTDTVYIFARASGEAGVPAAVLRQFATDFPIRFELNDSLAMMEGVKLSDFESVDITARISRDGNAMETIQSLETKIAGVVVADPSEVHLIIK